MRRVRASWLRGGTSKGLFFHAADLPPAGQMRDALVRSALGSPDRSGQQLNGMGGGISSTSKVAVVSRSGRPGFDIDCIFGQVGIQERNIDWSGSDFNLAAGVGLFALAEGLVETEAAACKALGGHRVRVWQVNHSQELLVHLASGVLGSGGSAGARAAGTEAHDDMEVTQLPGVSGREPPIYVELREPHGPGPMLPTGRPVDSLSLPDGRAVDATLVSAGHPTVFVRADAVGLTGTELPDQVNYASLLPLVDHLRTQAAPMMGAAKTDALRIAFVAPPAAYQTTHGDEVAAGVAHLLSRISFRGRIHRAHTGTGAIALACAARVEGSVPWQCIHEGARPVSGKAISIGHPGGVMEVRADVDWSTERGWHAKTAGFIRTARYLMRGDVFAPPQARVVS